MIPSNNAHEQLSGLDLASGTGHYDFDDAVLLGADVVEHLHGFDDAQRVAGLDGLPETTNGGASGDGLR